MERTSDGGATWRPGAVLPAGLGFGETVSCPTTEMCAGVVSRLQIAITTDAGAHFRIERLTAPPGISRATLSTVTCATATKCVVGVGGDAASTFLHTSNGGKSWTAASVVPAVMSRNRTNMGALQCDPDGSCIGLAFVGPNGTDQAAVRTVDGGRAWTSSHSIPTPRGASILQMTCGDGSHCTMLSDNGVMVMITAASDGHISWREDAFPRSWPDTGIDVSCATGRDCFISADGNSDAAIEATHDGGRTWEPISLPPVGGQPLTIVYPLSCPIPAGCIGVAATSNEFARGQKRVIISNLSPSG